MRYFSTVLFTLMASLAVAQPLRMPSEDLAKRHGGPAEITDEWGNVIYPKRPANLAERKAGPAEIAEVPDSELDKRVCDEGPLGRDCGNCMRPGGHCDRSLPDASVDLTAR